MLNQCVEVVRQHHGTAGQAAVNKMPRNFSQAWSGYFETWKKCFSQCWKCCSPRGASSQNCESGENLLTTIEQGLLRACSLCNHVHVRGGPCILYLCYWIVEHEQDRCSWLDEIHQIHFHLHRATYGFVVHPHPANLSYIAPSSSRTIRLYPSS